MSTPRQASRPSGGPRGSASHRRSLRRPCVEDLMAQPPSVRDVALDPDWVPHAFEGNGQQLTFVLVRTAARANLLFLSDGHFRGAFRKETFPAVAVASEVEVAARAPLHFIFNTSFCCSTLLAKALEVPGVSASLREPNILVDVAERLIQ